MDWSNQEIITISEFISENSGDKGDRYIMIKSECLSFTLAVDRCMDITSLEYNGVNIPYIKNGGIKSFKNDEERKNGEFNGGMLMTCGLDNIGMACETDGVSYAQHGSLPITPCESFKIEQISQSEIRCEAEILSAKNDKNSLSMTRTIIFNSEKSSIEIIDKVKNLQSEKLPVFIMYHYNFGSPFLSENCILSLPSKDITPKDEISEKYMNDYKKISPPSSNLEPHAIYHRFEKDKINEVSILNKDSKIKVTLEFDGTSLENLNQWKLFQSNKYNLSLEPCNTFPFGRAGICKRGMEKYIQGNSEINYKTKLIFSMETE